MTRVGAEEEIETEEEEDEEKEGLGVDGEEMFEDIDGEK